MRQSKSRILRLIAAFSFLPDYNMFLYHVLLE
jgi:hypothetical protein